MQTRSQRPCGLFGLRSSKVVVLRLIGIVILPELEDEFIVKYNMALPILSKSATVTLLKSLH